MWSPWNSAWPVGKVIDTYDRYYKLGQGLRHSGDSMNTYVVAIWQRRKEGGQDEEGWKRERGA